jgi:hypothetical protein
MMVTGEPAAGSVKTAGLVFAALFMIGLVTRMVRGRVW